MKNYFLFALINILCIIFVCSIENTGIQNNSTKNHCECIDYDCGCCTQLYIKKLVDGRLCSNYSYLPDQYGISVTITYNKLTIFNETVSVKNPPRLCIIHFDEVKMEICLRLYNLDIKNKCFSGCAEFEVEFFKVLPFKKLELGCFGCKNKLLISKEAEKKLLQNQLAGRANENKKEPEIILV